jgi:hypothetical protein
MEQAVEAWLQWLPTTRVAGIMNETKWAWPIAESFHFLGLSLLIGAVGSFDLRLMGLGKQIPIGALHRLIPWGVSGFVLNILTGLCFFTAGPYYFAYNPSFHLKVLFISLAGLNILVFYTTMFRKTRMLGPGEQAPLPARIIGGVSLSLWLAVITCGRLLTFYKPPFHWCEWC